MTLIMKTRIINVLAILMILMIFSACSSEPDGDSNGESQNVEKYDINSIINKIKMGQTKSDIKHIFGEKFIEIKNPNGSVEWRYDIGVNKGYTFETESAHEGKADVTGIELGKIQAQLFILWKNGKVNYVSMFYRGDEEKIHIFEMTNYGKTSDQAE